MDKVCKNCKWWGFNDSEGAVNEPLINSDYDNWYDFDKELTEEDVHEKNGYGIKFCQSPNLRFYKKPKSHQATIKDGSQYYGALLTGDKFGCNQFEENKQNG